MKLILYLKYLILLQISKYSTSLINIYIYEEFNINTIFVKGSPLIRVYVPGITEWVLVSEITFGPPDLQNDYPRHPQNSQSRLPLAGYEWYSSRLDMLRHSGFIESKMLRQLI